MAIEGTFADRHIGPRHHDELKMLEALGYKDLATFIADVVPSNIAVTGVIENAIVEGVSEVQAIAELRTLATKNKVLTSLIGTGYYGTIVPPVIKRNVLENPAWYTAYTIPTRNFTRSPRSTLCLSNYGLRIDWFRYI